MTEGRRIKWITFLTALTANALLTHGHPRQGLDTQLYIRLTDGLRSGHTSEIFTLDAIRFTKIIYLSLLAAVRALAPGQWMMVMMFVNVVCSALTAVLLVSVVRHAARWRWAWIVALLLYLACWDLWSWVSYILTDVVYTLVAFVPFVLVARRILIENEPFRPVLYAVALLVAVFTRPEGSVLVPLAVFAELVLVRRRISGRTAAAIIVLAAVAALVVRSAVVHDPARWPFRFVKPKIVEFSNREKTGEVIMDRKESFRPPPRTATDHAVIVVDRFARFFQITTSGFSRLHNAINLCYLTPLYLFGVVAVIGAFRGDDRRRSLVIALLMWLGIFAFLHALTVLDYDWRFRSPLMPHFVLLAVCGVDALMIRWRRGAAAPAR